MTADQPIFIGGMMRSGTTLMRAMLGQHSQLVAGLETFWFEIDPDAGTARNGEPLASYSEKLGAYFGIPAEQVLSKLENAGSAAGRLDAVMAVYARQTGSPRWVEKTPGNVLHADLIFDAWPDAKLIVMVRDPRAIFCSFLGTAKEKSPNEFAATWGEFLRAGEAALRQYGKDRVREVSYDGLVSQPHQIMEDVCRFLSLPFESAVATFKGQSADYEKVYKATNHASSTLQQLAKPLDESRAVAWRDKLNDSMEEALRTAAHQNGLGTRYDLLTSPDGPQP